MTNRSFIQFGTSSNRSISMAQSEKGRHERLETAEKFVRFVLRMSCSSSGPDICYTDYSTAADGLSLLASTVSDASMPVPTTRETIPSVHAVQNLLCTILTTPAPRGRASIVEEYLKIVGDGTGAVFSPNSVRKTATFLKFMFRLCIAFDHAVPHTTAEGADLLTTTRTTYEGSLASHLDSPSGPFATLRYISARASFFESEITASALLLTVHQRGTNCVSIAGRDINIDRFVASIQEIAAGVEDRVEELLFQMSVPAIDVHDNPLSDESSFRASFVSAGHALPSNSYRARNANQFESFLLDALRHADCNITFRDEILLQVDHNIATRQSKYICHNY